MQLVNALNFKKLSRRSVWRSNRCSCCFTASISLWCFIGRWSHCRPLWRDFCRLICGSIAARRPKFSRPHGSHDRGGRDSLHIADRQEPGKWSGDGVYRHHVGRVIADPVRYFAARAIHYPNALYGDIWIHVWNWGNYYSPRSGPLARLSRGSGGN